MKVSNYKDFCFTKGFGEDLLLNKFLGINAERMIDLCRSYGWKEHRYNGGFFTRQKGIVSFTKEQIYTVPDEEEFQRTGKENYIQRVRERYCKIYLDEDYSVEEKYPEQTYWKRREIVESILNFASTEQIDIDELILKLKIEKDFQEDE